MVFYHAGFTGFSGGFIGVDIFFVISGYLITAIVWDEIVLGQFSLVRFYERRARRILPALFAVFLACYVAGWFLLVPEDYSQLGEAIASALLFVSNIWFWQNSGGYFQSATDYMPTLHTWSLAVEEQFYIFLPLLLMALYRFARPLLLPATVLIVLCSLVLAAWATPRMPSASFYLLPTRIWELGVGALLALGVVRTEFPRLFREIVGVFGLVAVLTPVVLYDGNLSFPGLAAVPPVLGTAALIWAGTVGPVMVSRLLSLRLLVSLGLISYSLYLWHWPIMAFARIRLFTVELEPAWQVGIVLASIIAGWASWRFIERPFREPVHVGGMTQFRILVLSFAGIVGLGVLSVALMITGGMATQRFSSEQLVALDRIVGDEDEPQRCSGARSVSKLCTFGDVYTDTTPSWLVLGDSHAGAILPTLIDLAESRGRQLYVANKGGCLPLPQVRRSDMPPSESAKCESLRRAAVGMALSDNNLETVFLVARWPLYAEGGEFASGGRFGFRLIDTMPQAESDSPNTKVLQTALARLARELTGAGKTVVIVQTVPELPWNAVDRIEAEILFGIPFEDDYLTLSTVQARQGRTNAVLNEIGELANVIVIPVAEAICTPNCPVRDGFASYYLDNNHLSPLGADLLVRVLDHALGGNSTAGNRT